MSECDPQNCPTGIQLTDIKKSLDDTSKLYIDTHGAILEQTTAMKYMAEASKNREASVDKDIDALFSRARQTDEKIGTVKDDLTTKINKKIELSTLIKGATLVSLIFGMIAGILRLAGVV